MKTVVSRLMILAILGAVVCGKTQAQDQKRVPAAGLKAPSFLRERSKAAPKTLLGINSAEVVLITGRGGFGLSASTEAGAVFEYVDLGFDTKLKFFGTAGDFIYFESTGWQIIVAIRTTSPFDVWFFVNGGTDPIKYADSSRVYNAAK